MGSAIEAGFAMTSLTDWTRELKWTGSKFTLTDRNTRAALVAVFVCGHQPVLLETHWFESNDSRQALGVSERRS